MAKTDFVSHEMLYGWESHPSKRLSPNHNTTKKLAEKYRKEGRTIVLTQGSYDMIHIGHARYLEEAKRQGDILIVGLDSDEKVRNRKGEHRPIVPQKERLEMLAHLRSVDLVVVKEHDDPKWHLIKIVRPDVLVITERMKYSDKEKERLSKICGKVVTLESQATTSTSARARQLHTTGADSFVRKIMERFPGLVEEVFEEIKSEK